MAGIKILGTGAFSPPLVLTNAMLEKTLETSDEWIMSRTGISERRIAPADMTSLGMAREAARQAIMSSGVNPGDISVIIAATMTGDYLTPSLSCLLQRDLGIPESVIPLDVNCACSGFVFALKTAHALLDGFPGTAALVVGCEMLSRITDYADRATAILFGDGAGAAVIRRSDDGIFTFDGGARGDDNLLTCRARYLNNSTFFPRDEDVTEGVVMNGGEVLRFAERAASESILRALSKAGTDTGGVDWFVFHQANRRILSGIIKRLGIAPEKCVINIEKYGNTSSSSCAVALDTLRRSGSYKDGDRIVLSAFGGGLTYASAYIS